MNLFHKKKTNVGIGEYSYEAKYLENRNKLNWYDMIMVPKFTEKYLNIKDCPTETQILVDSKKI